MTEIKLTENQYRALDKANANVPVRWGEFRSDTITKLVNKGLVNWVNGASHYQITDAGRKWLADDAIKLKTPPKDAKLYLYQNTFQMEDAYKVGKWRAIRNNQLYYLLFTTNKQCVFILNSRNWQCEYFQVHGLFYPDGKWECIEAF